MYILIFASNALAHLHDHLFKGVKPLMQVPVFDAEGAEESGAGSELRRAV